jgi:hypothetical protein
MFLFYLERSSTDCRKEPNGIKAKLRTDQPGVQVYSCYWSDETAALKSTQGAVTHKKVTSSSCLAVQAQEMCTASTSESTPFLPDHGTTKSLADVENSPGWERVDAEITGRDQSYRWESLWSFRTGGRSTCDS